jgi:peptidoglycan/xylan/chitin deacetylase (PgdA/CDA1 family)
MSLLSRLPDKIVRSARFVCYKAGLEKNLYRFKENQDVVLLYHNVLDVARQDINFRNVSVPDFEKVLRYIKRHFNVVTLREIMTKPSTGRRIAITFDDGLVNNIRHALPVLETLQIPATFFISTPWLNGESVLWPDELSRLLQHVGNDVELNGERFHRTYKCQFRSSKNNAKLEAVLCALPQHTIDEFLSKLKQRYPTNAQYNSQEEDFCRVMKGEEIRILASSRFAEIGSHTVTHRNLNLLEDEELQEELKDSKKYLEQICQKPIDMFAFPFGIYSERILHAAETAGYKHLVAVTKNLEVKSDSFPLCYRIGLYNDASVTSQLHLINKSFE